MKAIPVIAIFAILSFLACETANIGQDQVLLSVSESREGKTLTVGGKQRSINPTEGQQLIIIQDEDTARYVVADGDTLALCDAIYHDPKTPWGNGKTVIAIKDNVAHLFIIIQDRDGARRLNRTELPLDAVAKITANPEGGFAVQGLQFSDGSTKGFNSTDSAIE